MEIDEEYSDEENHDATIDIKRDSYEADQLYCVHLMLKQAWGGNFGAPVSNLLGSGIKVLDVGCGLGYWTLEMASDFPSSNFYGISSTLSFPDMVCPENVRFKVSDILIDGLPYEDAEFDYAFARNIMFQFQNSDYKTIVMKEILRVVKPGGYIEIVEEEITEGHNRGEALVRWSVDGLKPLLKSRDIDCEILHQFKEHLISTNQLKDIKEEKLKIPIGKSNGFIGELSAEHIMCTIKSMTDEIKQMMNVTKEEYDKLIEDIEREVGEAGDDHYWYRRYIAIKI